MEIKLVKNLSFSKQYKCCAGTPSEIKCYPKNPNWDENWREKKNPNYSKTKQNTGCSNWVASFIIKIAKVFT